MRSSCARDATIRTHEHSRLGAGRHGTTSAAQLQTVAQQIADANDPGQTVQVTAAGPGTYRVAVAGGSSGPFATGIGSHDPRVPASAMVAVDSTLSTGVSTSTTSTTLTSMVTRTSTADAYSDANVYTPCTGIAQSGCLAIYTSDTNCSNPGYNSNSAPIRSTEP